MKNNRILLVEDEAKVAAAISTWLKEQQFQVDVASDGAVGRHLAVSQEYDLVLLDLNLPYVDGYELCQNIREVNHQVPIIILTAWSGIDKKLQAFEIGADDYMVKPFDLRELLVRMRAQMRRSAEKQSKTKEEILRVADLEINPAFKSVHRAGKEIELTAKEYALLEFLVRQNGRIVSRSEITEEVWDVNFDTGTNVVDVYITFLRRKIDRDFEPKLIHTKQGMGYYLKLLQ